jgi:hypothetical protein
MTRLSTLLGVLRPAGTGRERRLVQPRRVGRSVLAEPLAQGWQERDHPLAGVGLRHLARHAQAPRGEVEVLVVQAQSLEDLELDELHADAA